VIIRIAGVSVERDNKRILDSIDLEIHEHDKIFLSGANGSGKSSLLKLIAHRLHPYAGQGVREYGIELHEIALISREEQHRLAEIWAGATVAEFTANNLDFWQLEPLAARKLKTLSFGEMRRALIARVSATPRKLYLLDEATSGLSDEYVAIYSEWVRGLKSAAIIMTGHYAARIGQFSFNRRLEISEGALSEHKEDTVIIKSQHADYFHDFQPIFEKLSFELKEGDRVLVTGPNGAGKTTLLRIMHGDFYPAWCTDAPGLTEPRMASSRPRAKGSLSFLGTLSHENKPELWAKVQWVAAAHFAYYPTYFTVANVLASRYSGSIYSYPNELGHQGLEVAHEFEITRYIPQRFATLSEGEKTRVLFARAFLMPAPLYLIDEGFMALDGSFFSLVMRHLNALPDRVTVVIAANERIGEIRSSLRFRLHHWHIEHGHLATLL